jgi:hypothetical protein
MQSCVSTIAILFVSWCCLVFTCVFTRHKCQDSSWKLLNRRNPYCPNLQRFIAFCAPLYLSLLLFLLPASLIAILSSAVARFAWGKLQFLLSGRFTDFFLQSFTIV